MIKFNTQWFSVFIILVLVILLVLQRSCTKPSINDHPIIVTTIDTLLVPGKDSIVYKPKPYKVIYRDTIEIPSKVDTSAILKDYFAKVSYNDTIKVGEYGYILLQDTITENRIASRQKIDKFSIPVITTTTTITNPPLKTTQLYIGPEIAGNATYPINYFGGNIVLKTKQDQMYNAGIGISNGGTIFKIGMAWKIKIK